MQEKEVLCFLKKRMHWGNSGFSYDFLQDFFDNTWLNLRGMNHIEIKVDVRTLEL